MENTDKLYYNIGEVAEQFGINASKLRYYEKEFPSLKPKKGKVGKRSYTQADIDHIREIFEVVKAKGLKLPAARQYLQRKDRRNDTTRQSIEKLEKLKAFLVKMRDSL